MRSRLFGWVVALVGSLTAAPSLAEDVLLPDPSLSPAEVIGIQLSALQANDTPAADAGIAQTFAFAHPDNRRVTGPLPRFAEMIRGRYGVLLNHRAHEIKEVASTEGEAAFAVIVTSATGEVVGFRWAVARVADGEHAGAWMTIAVSPPVPIGNAI
jgi:hypothetical protein